MAESYTTKDIIALGLVVARLVERLDEVRAERDALIAALVREYADVLARRGAWEKPAILGQAEQSCYLHGVYHALKRVAERIGVTDLHARAAEVVARGTNEEGP